MDLTHGHLLDGRLRYAQPTDGYRTGIEPVLLAASIPAQPGQRVLEAGAGAAAALLCLHARVASLGGLGIELDPAMAALARQNLRDNAATSIDIVNGDILSVTLPVVDHAFANPPWHDPASTPPATERRRLAKHQASGALERWIAAMNRPLATGGSLTLILPVFLLPRALKAAAPIGAPGIHLLLPKRGRRPSSSSCRSPRVAHGPEPTVHPPCCTKTTDRSPPRSRPSCVPEPRFQPPARKELVPMRLLHVDSSARFAKSSSRALTAHFVAALRAALPGLAVDRLDVAADPLPHVSEAFTAAAYTPERDRTPAMRDVLRVSDALIDRLLAADAFVFGVPMYNFGMPSALKAFVDHIVRGGRTYVSGPDQTIVGMLQDKRALFVTARGSDFRPGSGYETSDALTPGLRAAFAFIGLTNVEFVDAQPLSFEGEDRKRQALADARAGLDRIAGQWAADHMAIRAA